MALSLRGGGNGSIYTLAERWRGEEVHKRYTIGTEAELKRDITETKSRQERYKSGTKNNGHKGGLG